MTTSEKHPLLAEHAALPDPFGAPSRRSDIVRGLTFTLVSAISQSLIVFFLHLSQARYALPAPTVLFIRGCTSTILALGTLAMRGNLSQILLPPRLFAFAALRGVVGVASVYFVIVAVAYLTAGTAMTILAVLPILASFASAVVFGEAFSTGHFVNLLINYAGVAIVVQSSASATEAAKESGSALHNALMGDKNATYIGAFFAIMGSIFTVFVFLLIKLIGNRVDSPVLSLHLGVFSLLTVPFIATTSDMRTLLRNHPGVLMAVLGDVCGFITQNAITIALRHIHVSTATVLSTLNVPLAFFLGYLFMHEVVTLPQAFGTVLVVGSVITSSIMQFKEKDRAEST